jgi:hypothetical protein
LLPLGFRLEWDTQQKLKLVCLNGEAMRLELPHLINNSFDHALA